MKCKLHQNVDAVGNCEKCGVGMCADCFDNAKFNWNGKPACYDCGKVILEDLIIEQEDNIFYSKIKAGLIVLTLILGGLNYYFNQDVASSIIIISLGGLPTAWKLTSLSDNDKLMNDVDDRIADIETPVGGIVSFIVRTLFFLVLRIAIAAIAAPILLIIDINKISKSKKELDSLLNMKKS